jgi:predicted outer membrane repeat protein
MFRHQQPGSHFRSRPSSRGVFSARRRRISVLEALEARTLLSGSPTIFTVDLTSDAGTGSDNKGDLLYCVTQANANTNAAGSEIQFAPTVFKAAAPQTVTLAKTLVLDETAGPEVIDGPGASVVTISGNNAVQVISVLGDSTATLSGLTVAEGNTNQGGGGIDNGGVLTVTNCAFSNNSTTAAGGGIENDGTLSITSSTFLSNSAGFGGGIENERTLSVTGSTIESNTATFGGGIDNDENGTLTLTTTTFSSNSATGRGGGIFNSGPSPLTVTGSTFSNNSARSGGGVFLEGDGADPPITTTVTDSTFTSDRATGSSASSGGGGFYNDGGTLSISGSTLSGNRATEGGGGIYASSGALAIIDSTVSGNSVTSSSGPGGGLYENGGTLNITNSTVAGNSAANFGAGIDENAGTLEAVNCTIADNTEPSTGDGFGGGLNVDQGTATLDNTIIALNTDGTGASAAPDNLFLDGSGTVSPASANNLIGAGGGNSGLQSGSNGNLVGVADPDLGTLASNGGPTQTIALLVGSPAIDAGSATLDVDPEGNALATDQRGPGFPRKVNGFVDIGAFEVQVVTNNPVPTLTTISPGEIAVGFASPLTLTVTGSGFISSSVVDWGSTALVTTDVSSTELTATIPASDFATTGSFPVAVVNPAPGGGTSTAATFQVLAAPSVVFVNTTYAGDPLGKVVTIGGSTHTVGYDAFGTVQAGVTAVASGGTVHIAAGTYTEQVTITQSLTLEGAGAAATTIQAPVNFFASSDEVAIASGDSVGMSGFTVASGANTGAGISDEGGKLSATDIGVNGFATGVSVQEHAGAKITDSTISSNKFGIVVGSSTSDTSTLTANNNNLAGDDVSVWNLQTSASASVDATLNWWGSVTGPTTSTNPGGTGSTSAGNVDFDPWLGDANLEPYDYLVFSTTAGSNYFVTPNSGNTELDVTPFLGVVIDGVTIPPPLLGTITGSDTLGFAGNGGNISIYGETGSIDDQFIVTPTSVQFANDFDDLVGTTINFIGTGMIRDVTARGLSNRFEIGGIAASGPSGTLVGDSGSNTFVFGAVGDSVGPGELFGNIQGAGSSTLDYSASDGPATVNLSEGEATGVDGTVSGITAIIGSNNAGGNNLNAGSVPDVALTGGIAGDLAANTLSGTGAGDSVVETLGSSYLLTDSSLAGQFDGSAGLATDIVDYLVGIKVANLVGNLGNSNSFNVSGWTGSGSLTVPGGSVGIVQATQSANFVLTTNAVSGASLLQTSDGMSLNLNPAIGWVANLGVNTFAGHTSIIDASGFSAGVTNLSAAGNGYAILYGGTGDSGSLTAAGSGDNILIGEGGGATLTDTSTGRSILIGAGPGGDTLVGGRNDILVGGTTQYDSDSSANRSVLDAILAEWTSSDPYLTRIQKIKRGVKRVGPFRFIDGFNGHTIHSDSSANTLSDGIIPQFQTAVHANALAHPDISLPRGRVPIPRHPSPALPPHSFNWFIAGGLDTVRKKPNEIKTVI